MIESGFAGYDVTLWYGVCAPTGTPQAVLSKVNADVTHVLFHFYFNSSLLS